MDNQDTLVSFDLETTGFIPGVHSAISLGAVAYRDGVEIAHFYGAMKEFAGSQRNASTMDWWRKHKTEWMSIRAAQEEPDAVMPRFYQWCKALPGVLTLAANPACFDAGLLWWYLHQYVGEDVINELFKRHRALDIRTYIMAVFNVPYSQAERSLLPNHWSQNQYITHNALDDAREQATVLMNLMRANSGEI